MMSRRLIIIAAFLPVLSATARSQSDSPDAVARTFLKAAYSHDATRFATLIFPSSASSLLSNSEPVTKQRLNEIETEARSVRLKQIQPFRQLGKEVKIAPDGSCPDGTTTRYETAFQGTITVISLIRKNGRWLVDTRWWLKLREMSLRDERATPEEKELLIKRFLLNLLSLNKKAVSESLVPGGDLGVVFEGAPTQPEPSDVLPSLAMEMPLVEAEPDEVYPLLSGKLVKKSDNGNETVMVGLFGPFETVFHLLRVKGEWRIAPEPYYRILNR
jgi:hypothetical protein